MRKTRDSQCKQWPPDHTYYANGTNLSPTRARAEPSPSTDEWRCCRRGPRFAAEHDAVTFCSAHQSQVLCNLKGSKGGKRKQEHITVANAAVRNVGCQRMWIALLDVLCNWLKNIPVPSQKLGSSLRIWEALWAQIFYNVLTYSRSPT
jgi:hypothetical protein